MTHLQWTYFPSKIVVSSKLGYIILYEKLKSTNLNVNNVITFLHSFQSI